jgi:hypothetical protein
MESDDKVTVASGGPPEVESASGCVSPVTVVA